MRQTDELMTPEDWERESAAARTYRERADAYGIWDYYCPRCGNCLGEEVAHGGPRTAPNWVWCRRCGSAAGTSSCGSWRVS